MKIEVACTSCRKGFLLDEAFGGTALPCPACATVDGLRVPDPRPAPPTRPRPARRSPQAAPRPAIPAPLGPTNAPAPQAMRPQPPQTDEEVVCPRCNLHFAPRRPGGGTDDAASSERPTVLVVEDMDFFREVAAEALAERFAVRTASTLQEARAALASGRVDLILLDLTLNGGEHGIDLLRDVGPSGVPVLIYTAQDESDMYGERWDDLRRLGATDVVAKGIHVGELLVRKATSLLGGRVEDLEPR